ncbi:Na+/H+ antiporter NhaC family protein, partial [Halomonas elongata]
LFALGLGGLMERVGVLQAISNSFLRWADNAGRLTLSTMLGGFFGNFFGGAAYVSLITASTITEKNYDKQGIDRRVLSRNAEAGGTITTPMVPWTDGGVFMAMTLGVSTLSYLPFLWYHMLVLLITLFYGYANIAIWRTGEPQEDTAVPGVAMKS